MNKTTTHRYESQGGVLRCSCGEFVCLEAETQIRTIEKISRRNLLNEIAAKRLPGETRFESEVNTGTVVCDYCGRKTWAGRARNQAGFCAECYELMGHVNQYSDEGNKAKEIEYRIRLETRKDLYR